ncbi:Por secretion system C-terminal sorting domain-containing protein [Flavobacterium resistens]|nr:T9SS sorting signal type C domain-containing protein [Flavobacterium resistens]SMO79341.1 Por secretion system C-terminal sorting domain-containing protein [Flavobacterium resistens]
MSGQSDITRIYTDWKTYWTSNKATLEGNRPDDANNLLAFTWKNKTYSTGVNNTILDTKGVSYIPQKFRALKIQSLGSSTQTYFLQGSMIDGSLTTTKLDPPIAGSTATGAELASRLTDGSFGLSLGTGIANIPVGKAEFKIGTNNLNLTGLDDGIPDLIVTQVADTGGNPDLFKFVDAAGNTVGTEISFLFQPVQVVGTYSLDLFKVDGTLSNFAPASTRDIRILGIETSSFGITDANAAQVDRFVVTFSGSSDCAFIAFNRNSLKIAELTLTKKATLSNCGKLGDKVNYEFEVTNTGEVTITDINVTDPDSGTVITGNPIASIAPGAKVTLTGVHTITATDVNLGKVINNVKVTGTDPSLNTVEDLSIPLTTILLTPPSIGTITNITCTNSGTVVLNDLPTTGTWTLERSPSGAPIYGTGSTTTISNLPAGTYTFRVTNSNGCKSPASSEVKITNQSSTTWNGSTWSSGNPDITKNIIFTGAYNVTADLDACSCTINSGVNLTIPSGKTLTIANGLTVATGGSLTFENSASLLQTNTSTNINSGSISYIRNSLPIRQADYVYWSTPVQGQTLSGVSSATASDKYLAYNGSQWVAVPNTSVMTVGKGYIIRGPENYSNTLRQAYSATFKGIPNNGTLSGETVAASKYYLVGNPYPSALDGNKFILDVNNRDILKGTLYFWTHNTPVVLGGAYQYNTDDYASYNVSGGVRTAALSGNASNNNEKPSGQIAAGQSFFVGTKAAGTITFNNTMRSGGSNNSQFFKPGISKSTAIDRHRLWLNMTNAGGAFKQLLVGYIEGATNDVDFGYDGATFDGNKYLDFYSINQSSKLVIQGRALPFSDTDTVPLGYKTTIAGDFTIAIDEADGELATQKIYLEDKSTNTIHDLTQSNYTFTTAIGTFTDRLVLRYTNKSLGTGDFENIENDVLVSVKNKTIKVLSSKENLKEISVYDISGRILYNKTKVNSTELQISNLHSNNQVLIVKVTLDNDFTISKKIIFQ